MLLVAANWGWRDALAAEKKAFGADAMPHGWVDNPKIYVSIDRDGTVGIVCNRSEMGQGVRTSLAMVVADELEADWSRVKVIQAPGDEARYGNQDTDGSRSMRHWFEPMRRCGAAARQMLEQAAANQWKVPLGECRAEQNKVLHAPSGRSLSFGELAEAAAGLEVPARDKLLLKKPEQFRYIGRTWRAPSTAPISSMAAPASASTRASTTCSTPWLPGRRSTAASSRYDAPPRR